MIKVNKNTKLNANAVGAYDYARRIKNIANAVGANFVRPQNSRGITLVALIITIIIMLILVGVSISMAINSGLFDITKKAAKETQNARNEERELANERIKIGETWYNSIEDYINEKPSENQEEGGNVEEPKAPTDLNESNTTFTYSTADWTKGPVKVTIETTVEGYTLEYTIDERKDMERIHSRRNNNEYKRKYHSKIKKQNRTSRRSSDNKCNKNR